MIITNRKQTLYVEPTVVHLRFVNVGYNNTNDWDDGPIYIKRRGKFSSHIEEKLTVDNFV